MYNIYIYNIYIKFISQTFILIINFLSKNSIKNTTNRKLQKAFNDKKILLTTRQPKKLRNLLVRAKFETKTIPKSPKLTGLFLCSNCVYHKAGYIIPCSLFSFKLTNGKTIT